MTQFRKWFFNYWPALIPIFLLNIFAIRQLYLSHYHFLSHWKGGGFGMFSEIDERFSHIHLLNRGTIQCAEPHSDIGKELRKIRIYPTVKSLEKVSKVIGSKTWIYRRKTVNRSKKIGVFMIGKDETLFQGDELATFSGVELQIFDIIFEPKTFTIKPKLIRSERFLKK